MLTQRGDRSTGLSTNTLPGTFRHLMIYFPLHTAEVTRMGEQGLNPALKVLEAWCSLLSRSLAETAHPDKIAQTWSCASVGLIQCIPGLWC